MQEKGDFYMTMLLAANWQQTCLFLGSWVLFYIVGRIFLDNGIGQYHSSHLKNWVMICKALFLSTFIIACTLLELLTFELLDVINPIIRQFIWTASFGGLCIILNILIPGVLAATISVHFDFPLWVTCIVSITNLVLFHCFTIVMRVFLPLHYSDPANSQQDISINLLVSQFFTFNIQASISLIAIVGTIIAAIIAAFATVSFPMEQLFVPKQIDQDSIESREAFIQSVMRTIVRKKKSLCLLLRRTKVETIADDCSRKVELATKANSFVANGNGRQGSSVVLEPSLSATLPVITMPMTAPQASKPTISVRHNEPSVTWTAHERESTSEDYRIPNTRKPSAADSHIARDGHQSSLYSRNSNTTSPFSKEAGQLTTSTPELLVKDSVAMSKSSYYQIGTDTPGSNLSLPFLSPLQSDSHSPPLVAHEDNNDLSYGHLTGSLSPWSGNTTSNGQREWISGNVGSKIQFRGYATSTKFQAHGMNQVPPNTQDIDTPPIKYAGLSHHSHPDLRSLGGFIDGSESGPDFPRSVGKCCENVLNGITVCFAFIAEVGFVLINVFRWARSGCSPNVAVRNVRSCIITSFIRLRLNVLGAFYWIRSSLFGIRSKPRHTSPCKLSKRGNMLDDAQQVSSEYSRGICHWLLSRLIVGYKITIQYVSNAILFCRLCVNVIPHTLNVEVSSSTMLDTFGAIRRLWRGACLPTSEIGDDLLLVPNAQNRQILKVQGEIELMQREIDGLQDLFEELFLELVSMRESTEKALQSGTWWGLCLRISGQVLTVMGVFRFVIGLWRVCMYLTAGSFVTVSQQADNVSAFLSFIFLYLRVNVDLEPWSPILGTAYVGCMALLHIRAFILSTEQFAKLGVVSTSTEIYSLLLAYMAGSYSIAGVLFLRSQLPTYRRVGVTAALGENIVLDFYFWLNDVVFVVATVISCGYFWHDLRRIQRLHEVATKAKFSRVDRNCLPTNDGRRGASNV